MPYDILRRTLVSYGQFYGVRAILWHQGETDNEAFSDNSWSIGGTVQNQGGIPPTNYVRRLSGATAYKDSLNKVIDRSRIDLGFQVPWVVAQASFRANSTQPIVTSGQEMAVNTVNRIFAGPATDGIVGPTRRRVLSDRVENNNPDLADDAGFEPTHFKDQGLSDAALAWANTIISESGTPLINSLQPATVAQMGTEARPVTLSSDGTTYLAPPGSGYLWLAESRGFANPNNPISTNQSISSDPANECPTCLIKTDGSNLRRALVQTAQGRLLITQSVPVPYYEADDSDPNNTPPTPPPTTSQCKNGNEASGGNRTPTGATVGGFGNPSEFMEYTFNVAAGGSTTFSIHYASGDSQAGIMLVVNGTSVPLYRPGTGSWTPNADASTTINLVGGTNTIRIQGSEAGDFSYDRICIGSGSTPPPTGCGFSIAPTVSNGNPACGQQGINLLANCSGADCGGVTFSWSGNGQSYSGSSPGITAPTSNGNFTYALTASKSGCGSLTNSTSINQVNCGSTPPFSIADVQLNCSTGVVTMSFNGANGSAIEYKAVGLQDWSTNQLMVPSWQRNGTSFVFYARQSGTEATVSFTSSCAGYRIATSPEPDAETGLVVSPNPTGGKVMARFMLVNGQRATLSVVSLSGQSLQTRSVVGTGKMQAETLDLSNQSGGVYVVRLQSGNVVKTAKVVLQR